MFTDASDGSSSAQGGPTMLTPERTDSDGGCGANPPSQVASSRLSPPRAGREDAATLLHAATLRGMRTKAHHWQSVWLERAGDHLGDASRNGSGTASPLDLEGMALCVRRAGECCERAKTIADCATAVGITLDQLDYAESDLTCECGKYHPCFDDARDCCLEVPS